MIKRLSAIAILALSTATGAHSAPLSANTWAGAENVSRSGSLGPSGTSGSSVLFTGNSNRTAVSPTSYSGPFTFSGTVTPEDSDDDVIGWTFGYVDGSNNYRIGWEGGGLNDGETNANGLWLIEESAGAATILFSTDIYWSGNTTYNFAISVDGTAISFSLLDGATTVGGGSVTGTRSTSGAIGVYANSQAATFANLDLTTPAVPLPASLPLLLAGFGGFAMLRRRGR